MGRKYERIIHIAVQVMRQEVIIGHLKWKVTDLSRLTKAPRSRIYALLGNRKSDILKNALRILLEELYGISSERELFDRSHSQFDGLVKSRAIVIQSPELLSFYFKNRNRLDEIGEIIRRNEERFIAKVRKINPALDSTQNLFVRTFIHGVSTSPFLSEAQVSQLMRKLSQMTKAGF